MKLSKMKKSSPKVCRPTAYQRVAVQWRFNCKNVYDNKHIYVLFQATFHFKTFKADEDKTPIDCSKELGQPFELLIGKKFKLEVWEELIKTMREKEVARFTCNKLV